MDVIYAPRRSGLGQRADSSDLSQTVRPPALDDERFPDKGAPPGIAAAQTVDIREVDTYDGWRKSQPVRRRVKLLTHALDHDEVALAGQDCDIEIACEIILAARETSIDPGPDDFGGLDRGAN